jgi:tetratricopeptide (TPR) repeat protein
MNEQNGNKHEMLRHTDSHENTTRIWRSQGEPLGSSANAGDKRFVRRTLLYSGLALIVLAVLGWLAVQNATAVKSSYASLLIAQSKYSQAERVIDSIDNEQAKLQLQQKLYFNVAESYVADGRTADAVALFQAAGDYPGAVDELQKTGYALAQIYEADGDYLEASQTYDALGDYLDAVEKSKACSYAYAQERLEYGYYDEAMRLFYALGSYENAEAYAKEAAAELSQNAGAGDLVSLLVGLSEDQLAERARLKAERDALPAGIIATGYKHTVARTDAGTVLATGSNLSGQCNTKDWTNIIAVAAGAYHTVGLRADGTVVATGMNTYGQCDVGKWMDVIAVYAGAYNTVAITSSGEILNTGYQKWNTLQWRDVASLSIGDYALCGVMLNGQPLSTSGTLVTSDYFDLVALDAATANSAGLKADGTLVSNGLDVSGLSNILALECTANGIYALDEAGKVFSRAFSFAHLPDVSDWQNVVAISASATHIIGVTRDGRVLSRGESDMGQCDTQEWVLFTPVATPEPSEEPTATPAP